MKAILTQPIGVLVPPFMRKGVIQPGMIVDIVFYEKPRGSYRRSHRTPYHATFAGLDLRLSRNSFKFIEGAEDGL